MKLRNEKFHLICNVTNYILLIENKPMLAVAEKKNECKIEK